MKTAVTIADVANIDDPREDVFDIYRAYAETVISDPAREEETRERQGYFHPSALGMCARRNVYEARREPFVSYLGVPDLEIFETGHYVHDRVQGVLEQVGRIAQEQGLLWSFTREVPFDRRKDRLFQDLKVGGTCDGELTIEKPGEWKQRGIIEIKSMKDEYWEKATAPKKDHTFQAHVYAFRFDAPIIWYWYYNKNTSRHRVHPTAFDKKIFDVSVDRLVMFNDHLDAGTLPDREESWYFCQRCEYQDTCLPPSLNKKPRGSSGVPTKTRARARNLFKKRSK